MARKPTKYARSRFVRRQLLSPSDSRIIAFLATLILIGLLSLYKVDSPAIYAFLGLLVGSFFGKR
jgi:hypothetical protein